MKTIATKSDLAINGAEPLFDAPLHVGRPNIGSKQRFLDLVEGMFERNWLTNNGPLVTELEEKIAAMLGVRHCVAMCNGTVALEIAIRALDLRGEVIVPSYTFVATAHALDWQGITPVFADIDPSTHNLDPVAVEKMITPRTSGIIGVHLWGNPAPVEELQELADRHGLSLLYDAAHAFGAVHRGKAIGNFGRAEVLSFHATKFFNTFEGGAVVTNDDRLAHQMRLMRNFGFSGYDNVVHPGTNGKMTEVCAAMGLANLSVIDATIAGNRRTHDAYRKAFSNLIGASIRPAARGGNNNYQYVVLELSDDVAHLRDCIVEALHAENILARKYFWPGIHRMRPYRDLYPHSGLMLPHTDAVARRVIVLPGGPSIDESTVAAIQGLVAIMIDSEKRPL